MPVSYQSTLMQAIQRQLESYSSDVVLYMSTIDRSLFVKVLKLECGLHLSMVLCTLTELFK